MKIEKICLMYIHKILFGQQILSRLSLALKSNFKAHISSKNKHIMFILKNIMDLIEYLFKGSDRLCMVVELSMQYCGQIL